MRKRLGVAGLPLLLVAILAALVALGPAAASADAVKLTFIGDSKVAMIEYSPRAKRLLSRGHDARRDLKVCRRLVAPSCPFQGSTPRTALGAIRYYGRSLGRVLVIDVGYNDHSATYRRQLDRVMRAALARGVKGVVWVNLKAVRPDYERINRIINLAQNRWPQLYMANWNRYSRGHPGWLWPKSDGGGGIHLTTSGAVGLVRLVRAWIPRAAEGARTPPAAAAVIFDYPVGRGAATGTTFVPAPVPAAEVHVVADSQPVGSNLGGSGDTAGLRDFLPLAGGAALMLFLVLVTARAASRRLN
ncbi:MAG: hypothetical protein ACRDNG_03150 [Gaiellaceae bacterium]